MTTNMDYPSLKLGIVTLTVGHWDLMDSHIRSIYDNYPYPKELYIVPNLAYERSLSAALNTGFKRALREGCDYIAYIADDVSIGPNSIETLLSHLENENKWIVHALGETNSAGWDMFVVDPIIFKEVGFFDEIFYPAYFEDNSFARRLTLRDDTKYLYQQGIDFFHLHSQTVQRMSPEQLTRHHHEFGRLRMMYIEMWGGDVGAETYTEAWNGNPPEFFDDKKITLAEKWEG